MLANSHIDHLKEIAKPYDVLKLMYYFEHLVCFVHCYALLSYLDRVLEEGITSLIDIYSKAPQALTRHGILSRPYYINVSGEEVIISAPKVLVQPSLALTSGLLK